MAIGFHGYNRSLFSALLDTLNVHTNLAFVLFLPDIPDFKTHLLAGKGMGLCMQIKLLVRQGWAGCAKEF